MSLPRPFWYLWTASAISNVGDGVLLAAIPLLAADLTRDPLAVAGVTIAVRLPWLLFGLLAGALVDRMDRRRTMVVIDVARAAALLAMAVLVTSGLASLPLLYLFVFSVGMLETLFDTAAQSIVPALVQPDDLESANGQLFSAELVANTFVGPPLGGLLFVAAISLPFIFDAGSFALSALLLLFVHGQFRPRSTAKRKSIFADVREGIAFIWGERLIRDMAFGAAVINIAFTASAAVLVLHAQDNLGLGSVGFGLLLASGAVGGVAGAQIIAPAVRLLGRARATLGSVILMAVALGVLGSSSNPWLAGTVFAFVGLSEQFWNVIAVSYRQAATPDELLGRVMSSYRVIAYGAFPIGAILGGVIAATISIRATFFAGALLIAALAAVFALTLREDSFRSSADA